MNLTFFIFSFTQHSSLMDFTVISQDSEEDHVNIIKLLPE